MKNPNALVSSLYGQMIVNLNDSVITRHILEHGYWAIQDIELIKSLIAFQLQRQPTVMFYDVGANIGTHSLAVAKSFSDRVTVRSFEVQRQIFTMLCGTMALNNLSNVHCHHNAVSQVEGEVLQIGLLDYHAKNNFGALELMPPVRSDQQAVSKVATEPVRTLTLDSFDERVDFIKIDVEGMEDKVLEGARAAIGKYRPILFVEIHKTDSARVMQMFSAEVGNYVGFLRGIDLILIPLEYGIQVENAQRVI